jgi:hypothetical protein
MGDDPAPVTTPLPSHPDCPQCSFYAAFRALSDGTLESHIAFLETRKRLLGY